MKSLTVAAVAAVTLVSSSAALGAQCKGQDGQWYDYNSPECMGGRVNTPGIAPASTPTDVEQVRIYGAKPATHPDNDDLTQRCVNRLHLKDPGSAQFGSGVFIGAEAIKYAGTTIMARKFAVSVNAKNSYGGYTGSKTHVCYISPASGEILKVQSFE